MSDSKSQAFTDYLCQLEKINAIANDELKDSLVAEARMIYEVSKDKPTDLIEVEGILDVVERQDDIIIPTSITRRRITVEMEDV